MPRLHYLVKLASLHDDPESAAANVPQIAIVKPDEATDRVEIEYAGVHSYSLAIR